MDQRVRPSARIEPLPPEHSPELKHQFESMRKNLGFIPNGILIMQRKPKMTKAFAQMTASIWDPEGKVDRGLKRLIAHVASRTAGCQYCMAHTAGGALHFGVEDKKLAAVWGYQSSPLFSAAERAALDLAVAGASVPNTVTDEMFATLRAHWSEEQIVEIVGVIAMFGFLNRWNGTLATPLEDEPIAVGQKYLALHGWSAGKHNREPRIPNAERQWRKYRRVRAPLGAIPERQSPKYLEGSMTAIRRTVTGLTLSLALFSFANAALAADNGLITEQSRYSVRETVARFESAVKEKESLGFMVFTEIDHAAAARKFGLEMRPRTVIVFGNPKLGTPVMVNTPTLAIDVPPKALVWEDDQGKVWLSYNSAEYLGKVIYARHGLADPPSTPKLATGLRAFADYATK